MPKDAKELFDVDIPAVLQQHPDKAKDVNAVFYFNITGAGGGEWTVDLASETPKVSKGNAGNSQCSMEIAHEDFQEILKDPQVGMQLYFQGKLKISGDPMVAMRLSQLMELAKQNA